MKKTIILSTAFCFIIIYGSRDFTRLESANKVSAPTNIHWGTGNNTLRGVTFTWQSSVLDDSIKWGYSEAFEAGTYGGTPRNIQNIYIYDFTFPTLKASSQLHYAIKSGCKWGKNRIFVSSTDTSAEKFSFIAGSDCHGGDDDHDSNSRWKLMSELILKKDSDFYILTGDVVDDENDWSLWDRFYESSKSLLENKIIFYSWGNHEFGPLALEHAVLPANEKWYSFTQENALFICLLSEEDFDLQYQWLLDQLNNCDKEWIIVSFHRPFFTRGSHKDEMNELRSTWWKAFDDYGVDVVLGGHTHSYIRTKPLNLNISDTSSVSQYGSKPGQGRLAFVLGGMGGPNSKRAEEWFIAKAYSGLHYVKFNINGNRLHFDTYTTNGTIIDSLTIFSTNTE